MAIATATTITTTPVSNNNDHSIFCLEDQQQCRRSRRCGQAFGKAFALKPCIKQGHEQQQQQTFITNLPPTTKKLATDSDDESDTLTAVTEALSFDEDDDDCFSTASTSASSAIATSTASAPIKKSVRFDSVEVRHYGRTVDDHPCTHSGPALTLTWKVELREKVDLTTFECIREEQRLGSPRHLGPAARQELLMQDWNVSAAEIRNAMYVSQLIQKQRNDTLQELRDAWYYGDDADDDCCYFHEDEDDCYTYSDSDEDEDEEELLWDLAQEHYTAASQRYAVDAEEEDEPHLLAYDY